MFEPENQKKPIILGIGVGGGGSNVVNYIHKRGIEYVSLIVANTDAQALEESPVPTKLQLGPSITHGLGAGAKPEIGESAAIESEQEIKKLFTDSVKMVFITAGMGGGTGTGSAPVIASIAKEKGLLVVGVVTSPFAFEGTKKQGVAEDGIRKLSKYCDTLIIIENEQLIKQEEEFRGAQQFTLSSAFALADEVLYKAITSITDPIYKPGVINVDFRDMDTILRDAGSAVMGSGHAKGKERGLEAAKKALSYPLLRYQTIQGASRLLLTIFSSPETEVKVPELMAITSYIRKQVGADVEMMIWGHAIDPSLGEEIRVNIIASGFLEKGAKNKNRSKVANPISEKITSFFDKQPPSAPSYTNGNQPNGNHASFDRKNASPDFNQVKQASQQKIRFFRERTSNLLDSIRDGDDQPLTEKEVLERIRVPAYIRARISLEYTPMTDQEPERFFLYPEREDETGV